MVESSTSSARTSAAGGSIASSIATIESITIDSIASTAFIIAGPS